MARVYNYKLANNKHWVQQLVNTFWFPALAGMVVVVPFKVWKSYRKHNPKINVRIK